MNTEKTQNTLSQDDLIFTYFNRYFQVAPFALALWRGKEAFSIMDGYIKYEKMVKGKRNSVDIDSPFKRPLLDVGCGFGEFAGVFFENQVEVGVDISQEDLIMAQKGEKYKKLFAADARKLPFKSNTFATVLSMSVLEHIIHPELAIQEIYNVLKPGGIFIYTVPTSELNTSLLYPSLLKQIGLNKISSLYLQSYHKAFKHVNIMPSRKWLDLTKKAGFEVVCIEGTFSRTLVRWFDFLLPTSLLSQISRWLFGTRWVWGMSIKRPIVTHIFKTILKDKKTDESNILIIARK